MSTITHTLDPKLYQYLINHSLKESIILKKLREVTSGMNGSHMLTAPEQCQFMAMLVKLMGAKRILEIGTYTGYSSSVMALALPKDGRLITLDRDPNSTPVAKQYWQKLGVADKVELVFGDAMESLKALQGLFDLAFIDANQRKYQDIYEMVLALVKPGGLIIIDNVFKKGAVVAPEPDDKSTLAIDAFNKTLYNDNRVELSMLPIADGLTLARKV